VLFQVERDLSVGDALQEGTNKEEEEGDFDDDSINVNNLLIILYFF